MFVKVPPGDFMACEVCEKEWNDLPADLSIGFREWAAKISHEAGFQKCYHCGGIIIPGGSNTWSRARPFSIYSCNAHRYEVQHEMFRLRVTGNPSREAARVPACDCGARKARTTHAEWCGGGG